MPKETKMYHACTDHPNEKNVMKKANKEPWSVSSKLSRSQHNMAAGVGEERLTNVANLQAERDILEWLLHLASSEEAQISVLLGRTTVTVFLRDVPEVRLSLHDFLTKAWGKDEHKRQVKYQQLQEWHYFKCTVRMNRSLDWLIAWLAKPARFNGIQWLIDWYDVPNTHNVILSFDWLIDWLIDGLLIKFIIPKQFTIIFSSISPLPWMMARASSLDRVILASRQDEGRRDSRLFARIWDARTSSFLTDVVPLGGSHRLSLVDWLKYNTVSLWTKNTRRS